MQDLFAPHLFLCQNKCFTCEKMKCALFFVLFLMTLLQAVYLEGNMYTSISGQGLQKETNNECDQVISDQYGVIKSPGFPAKYPRYSRCQYTIQRYSPDVCEVKLTIERFEVAKMTFSNCSADFFEVQNGRDRYRLCGELPGGSKKFAFFPEGSNRLVFKFQNTFHQKRGFLIEVKQLPFSCKKMNVTHEPVRVVPSCTHTINGRIGRITFPSLTDDKPFERCTYKIKKSETRGCIIQLDFSSFKISQSAGCETNYLQLPGGQRLCGVLGGSRKLLQFPRGKDELVLEFVSSGGTSNSFDIQVTQLPGSCEQESASNTTGKLSQQCDQTIKDTKGRITSPGFPGVFSPNYECSYKIFRPDPSVCQIELEFLTFSLGKHNPLGCATGAYLELPGKHRLCHDESGKTILKVSEFKDPVIFQFRSDRYTSGRGFEIKIDQIPNTCPGYKAHSDFPNSIKRCYQEVTAPYGYFSTSNINTHFPLGMPMWCEFVVRRADPTVCKLKLQITARSFLDLPCINNFIHLPNGERMCVSVTERRELWIPNDSEYVTMVYYNTNNPEFTLYVDQISNSCKSENLRSHRSTRWRWAWDISPR